MAELYGELNEKIQGSERAGRALRWWSSWRMIFSTPFVGVPRRRGASASEASLAICGPPIFDSGHLRDSTTS